MQLGIQDYEHTVIQKNTMDSDYLGYIEITLLWSDYPNYTKYILYIFIESIIFQCSNFFSFRFFYTDFYIAFY